tara:strand:- start:24 stop:251 length:228 start_codon:yes stop_codon:yes gene_type:complete
MRYQIGWAVVQLFVQMFAAVYRRHNLHPRKHLCKADRGPYHGLKKNGRSVYSDADLAYTQRLRQAQSKPHLEAAM